MIEDELQKIFRLLPERRRGPQTFSLGDAVLIRSGPFAGFTGRVEGINQARSLVKVVVTTLGRAMPLKLNFMDIEKL